MFIDPEIETGPPNEHMGLCLSVCLLLCVQLVQMILLCIGPHRTVRGSAEVFTRSGRWWQGCYKASHDVSLRSCKVSYIPERYERVSHSCYISY